jgi:hypothetical protein
MTQHRIRPIGWNEVGAVNVFVWPREMAGTNR